MLGMSWGHDPCSSVSQGPPRQGAGCSSADSWQRHGRLEVNILSLVEGNRSGRGMFVWGGSGVCVAMKHDLISDGLTDVSLPQGQKQKVERCRHGNKEGLISCCTFTHRTFSYTT